MLYLCATPIGNLGDLTLRVIDALKSCDVVYCEDTRHTLQLLNHLEIQKPLVSCHQHNEKQRAKEAAVLLKAGKTVVYASDAGMPGISDPGAALVDVCIGEGLDFTVLPGASAVLTAAVLSGLPSTPFSFFGFLPRETKPRRQVLEQIRLCGHLALVYESPLRIKDTLSDLMDQCGDCKAAVMRELTKKFEEVKRGRLSELIPQYAQPPKGECVVAVYPDPPAAASDPEALDRALLAARDRGLSARDAAAEAALLTGVSKNEAYARLLSRLQKET